MELYATESSVSLPSNDDDIPAALARYGAKYAKGTSKRCKTKREETLASLSWLHLNHDDVATALRRISEPQQLLLATALSLDYDTKPTAATPDGPRFWEAPFAPAPSLARRPPNAN